MVIAGQAAGAVTPISPSPPPTAVGPVAITNLRTGAASSAGAAIDDGHFAFPASETDQQKDLNGDGDQTDTVLEIWDPSTGRVTDTGLGTGIVYPMRGGRAAFAAYEPSQGNRDLNGDGDSEDVVAYIWDDATGQATNLGVVASGHMAPLAGGEVAISVSEAWSANQDFNGDGDTTDFVLFVWDPVKGLINLHTAADHIHALDGGGVTFFAGGHPRVWTPAAGLVDVGVASGTILTPLRGGGLAFLGLEAKQHRDLNGDGDQSDKVVEVWRPGSGITNLGLAGTSDTFAAYNALPDGGLALVVSEADQGGRDLNSDGDSADWVIHLWRPGTGAKNLGLAVHFPGNYMASFAGDGLAVMVREADQGGRDLNGDGDTSDRIVELWTPGGGVRNLGIATAGQFVPVAGGGVAFSALEADQGNTDLNGDGVSTDSVLFVARPDGSLRDTWVSASRFSAADGGRLVYMATEGARRDLNGDGDTVDQVLGVYDPSTDTTVNSGLAGQDQLVTDLGGGRFAFVAAERSQNPGGAPGTDLNGDGDTADGVMEVFTAFGPPPTAPADQNGAGSRPQAPEITGPTVPGTEGGRPPTPAAPAAGYWMVGSDGAVYAFGSARGFGNAPTSTAVDLEPTRSGRGYWIVDEAGRVFAFGEAGNHGSVDRSRLAAGEKATSLSATPSGSGYWVFTSRGRVLPFGDAPFLGDMSATRLAGPVLGSIPTPSGRGYYMVASDGGIFSFGDARFYGSMGGVRLNAPVQSLVPDPDGVGYWLVANDGGIFAFDAAFRGSMGGTHLNRPVVGMVASGNGYLMVAADGGIFDFSGSANGFHGSLGAHPPAKPVVSAAVAP